MTVIIAGSRKIKDYNLVKDVIKRSGFEIEEVVSGGCDGVDKLGERYAKEEGIPVKPFLAQWKKFGLAAGPIRNSKMARYGDALIAILTPSSRGTRDMLAKAQARGLKIFVEKV